MMVFKIRNVFILAGGIMFSSWVGAVPPAPGQRHWPKNVCHVNSAPFSKRIFSALGAPSLVPPTKNYSILVVRVQFPDRHFGGTDNPGAFFQNVRNYYGENSYGVFHPTFTLSSVFTLPNSMSYYGNNCGEDVSCNAPRLIAAAAVAVNPSVDFNDYDQVMIYHAGYGEESTDTGSDIWSMFAETSISADGKSFNGATIVPELERNASALGVICHEYGHQLGLPDLYDTSVSGGKSTVGAWDLMDYPWVGTVLAGDNPPHLGAWSKRFLGFGSTEVMSSSGTVSLSPMELAPGKSFEIFRTGSEYFLLEYRLRSSSATYDHALPVPAGLAVWHVDEQVVNDPLTFNANVVNAPSANRFRHAGVDLVEADGNAAYPPGDDDLWVDGGTLSSPASDLFSGAVSSLVLTGISGAGGPFVSARTLFLAAKDELSVDRGISYPNPSTGQARAGAPAGTWSTFKLQLTRPVAPSALKATLFTILGQRVLEVPGTRFVFRDSSSRDYEWVYEFDWDGLDETGAEAASGVYYLQFEVEGKTTRKPIVVQR